MALLVQPPLPTPPTPPPALPSFTPAPATPTTVFQLVPQQPGFWTDAAHVMQVVGPFATALAAGAALITARTALKDARESRTAQRRTDKSVSFQNLPYLTLGTGVGAGVISATAEDYPIPLHVVNVDQPNACVARSVRVFIGEKEVTDSPKNLNIGERIDGLPTGIKAPADGGDGLKLLKDDEEAESGDRQETLRRRRSDARSRVLTQGRTEFADSLGVCTWQHEFKIEETVQFHQEYGLSYYYTVVVEGPAELLSQVGTERGWFRKKTS